MQYLLFENCLESFMFGFGVLWVFFLGFLFLLVCFALFLILCLFLVWFVFFLLNVLRINSFSHTYQFESLSVSFRFLG